MSKIDTRNTELFYWQAFHKVAQEKSREGALGIWVAYLRDKFSNPDKMEKHLDFLLNKGLPAMSSVENKGDIVKQVVQIYQPEAYDRNSIESRTVKRVETTPGASD